MSGRAGTCFRGQCTAIAAAKGLSCKAHTPPSRCGGASGGGRFPLRVAIRCRALLQGITMLLDHVVDKQIYTMPDPCLNGATTMRIGLDCCVSSMWRVDAGARWSDIHCNQEYLSDRLGQAWRKSDHSDVGKADRDLSEAVLPTAVHKHTSELAHMQIRPVPGLCMIAPGCQCMLMTHHTVTCQSDICSAGSIPSVGMDYI